MKNFITVLISWALVLLPVSIQALPSGQQVVNGTAKFNTNANTMNIAASNKAIINYNSFNINNGEVVNFLQPSSSSVVLNRVIKANPSSIMGALNANGRVFLINPAGIVFGANSIVNTNSFLATTLDIKNTDFINGNYAFSQSQNKLPSYILQKGTITVSPEGFVVLASPLVKSDGLIYAKTGKIRIGGVDNFYLNFDQRGLVKFNYKPKDSTKTDVLISNDVAQSLMQDVVNNKKTEEATNIVEKDAVIKLVSGSGTALVSGKLSTNGDKAGNIGVVSQNYTALLDGAKLSSNANKSGNGGNIYVYSDNNAYSSKGASLLSKANQGNGGTIELSAKNSVLYDGSFVDTSSRNGEFGLFYTDPEDLTISSNVDISSNYFSKATKSIVLDSSKSINTNGGDIKLEAPSITLNENSKLQSGSRDITLSANSVDDASIDIKDGVQISGRNIALNAITSHKGIFDSDSDNKALKALSKAGDFILPEIPFPIAYRNTQTTSTIDIGAAKITGDNIDISSEATSDVSVSSKFELLALAYGKSYATSSLHVKSGATLHSTGDLTLKSEATSSNDVSAIASNILHKDKKEKQANLAIVYSDTLTNSDATVDSGVDITAGDFKLLSIGNKDTATSATAQSLNLGAFGVAIAISNSKSNINSSLGGTVKANSVEVRSTTNIDREKTSSSSGVGTGFVNQKILNEWGPTIKNKVMDKLKKSKAITPPATKEKNGARKRALSAAVSYSHQENNSKAKIADAKVKALNGDVTVSSDISYSRNGPYTKKNGNIKLISDKGLKTIAIATIDSADKKEDSPSSGYEGDDHGNEKENSASGALDITNAVNNSDAFIDDDAIVDAIDGEIRVYSNVYLGYLNFEWGNILHFNGIKDILWDAKDKVMDLVGFRGNIATSFAQSNAQGTKNSLAGSFDFFKFTSNVNAHIGKNVSINQNGGNGALEVLANNNIHAINLAGVVGWTYFGTKAANAAIGGSYLDVRYAGDTKAYIQKDTYVNATRVKVAANKNTKNISISTAGGSGKYATSGSFSYLTTDDNTYAYIDGATITTSDGINDKKDKDKLSTNLRVDAEDYIAYIDGTGGVIKGKNLGIGVSGSLNIIKRDTQAYINDSTINRTSSSLDGLDYVKAYNGGSINTFAIAASVIPPDEKKKNKEKSSDATSSDATSSDATSSDATSSDATSSDATSSDATSSDASLTDTKSTDGEEKGTFGFAVSGDASINKTEDKANAYIKGTTSIKGSQDVNILAKNDTNIGGYSGSGALAFKKKSAGLAGSYAGNYFFNQANAYMQNATLNVNSMDIQAQNSGTISTLSGSGSVSSGFTSLAGSVSINEISNQTNSYVDDSTLTLSDDLKLNSTDDTVIKSLAGALSLSKGAGIGLSFAKNSIHNNLASYIQNSSLDVGDISIYSYQDNSIKNIAASLGGSMGILAAAGSVSINEIDNSLDSYILGSNINSGDIGIKSLDESSIGSIAGSVSGASSVAFGGAILYNKIANKLNSYVRDANIKSKSLTVKSISDKDFTGITVGGAGAGTVSIAGGVLINDVKDNINAYIYKSTLNIDNSMLAHAIEQNKIRTYGGAVSGAGAVGIGGTIVRNKASNSIKAYIKDSTVDVKGADSLDIPDKDKKDYKDTESFNGLSILALSNEDLGVYTANGSGAGTVALAATASFNTISDKLDSYILGSSINQDNKIAGNANQEVLVRALSYDTLNINGGTLDGAGAVGIGGTLNNSYIQNTTHAYTDNSSVNAQKLIEVRAESSEDTTSRVVAGAGAGTAALAGSVSLLHIANKNEADIDKGSTLLSQKDLNIISKDNAKAETWAGALSVAGIAGVGGSVVVNNVKNSSLAHIDDSKVSAKGKLYMHSSNEAALANTAATGALGAFAGAGTVIVNTVDSITKSYTSHNDEKEVLINQYPSFKYPFEQSVDIEADDYAKVDDALGSGSGGLAAVAGAIDVSTLKNDTSAYLGKDTKLFAKKDLDIHANSNKDFSVKSLGAAVGAVGVGGAVVIANIGSSIENDALKALANTKSVLDNAEDSLTKANLGTSSLSANTKNDLKHEKGTMNDDSSFDKTIAKTNKTKAHINSNAKVNVGNNLNINAQNSISTLSVTSGGAAGGILGVGGAVALVYLGADNRAYINDRATIDANFLKMKARYNTGNIDIESFAGSLGVISLGADYSRFLNDYTNESMVGDNTLIVTKSNVDIGASTYVEKLTIGGYGANKGAAVAGISAANTNSKGITNTLVSRNSVISSGGNAVFYSTYYTNIDSQTSAAAGGVIGVTGSSSNVIIDPTITTEIANGAKLRSVGDIEIDTILHDKLSSEADGYGVGGITVGTSYAQAKNTVSLNSIIGDNVMIAAGRDFKMLTYENINLPLNSPIQNEMHYVAKEDTIKALAKSSVGSLIAGATGSSSIASNDSYLTSKVGTKSKITTKKDITIETGSYSDTSSKSLGAAYGIVSLGATHAKTHNSGKTMFELGEGSTLMTHSFLYANTAAVRNARAIAFGGAGGLLSASGTKADIDIDNLVSTIINDNTNILSAGSIYLLSSGSIYANALSSTSAKGGITANTVQSKIDINQHNLNKQNISTYIGKSNIAGSRVYIKSESSPYAESDANSKTNAVAGVATANALLNLVSNNGIVFDGSNIIGRDVLNIDAVNQDMNYIHAITKAEATIGHGLVGILNANVKNNPTFNSSVVFKNNAKIQADHKNITVAVPDLSDNPSWGDKHYIKSPVVINHSVTHEIEEKVWELIDVIHNIWGWVTHTETVTEDSHTQEHAEGHLVANSNVIENKLKGITINRDFSTITTPVSASNLDYDVPTVKFYSSPNGSQMDNYNNAVKIDQDYDFAVFNPSSISSELGATRPSQSSVPVPGSEGEVSKYLAVASYGNSGKSKISFDKSDIGNVDNAKEGVVIKKIPFKQLLPTFKEMAQMIQMHKNEKFVIINNRFLGGKLLDKYIRMTMFKTKKPIVFPTFKVKIHIKKENLISSRKLRKFW